MRNSLLWSLVISLVFSLSAVRADYDDGKVAYELSNFESALGEFRLAAKHGEPRAQYMLGVMYEHGRGVGKGNAAAMKWYRMAAEQGHAKSQYKLGLMHEKGMGRPAVGRSGNSGGGGLGVTAAPTRQRLGLSYAEAVKWYSMAANQGFVDAQYNLGLMYASGGGIPEDYMGAYLWWTVANAYGNEQAGTKLNILKSLMSERDIVEAQRLARDWWEKRR